jgi:hypothetical protein
VLKGDDIPAVLSVYGDDYFCPTCGWLLAEELVEDHHPGASECPRHGSMRLPVLTAS